ALSVASMLGKGEEAGETDPRFSEAIRTIRTAISLDNLDKPHKIILVTSSIGSEGKSIFALNLAVAFGRAEKTLLLDGDLRRPAVGRMLGLPRDAPGLSELLSNSARLPECVIGTGVKDLDAISTGFIPPILGIVLTQFDVRKAEKYGNYDYGSYYEPDAAKS